MIAVVLVAFAAHVVAWIVLPYRPAATVASRVAPANAGGRMSVSGV